MPHAFLYARLCCADAVNMLERRVKELDSRADIAAAVSAAQKEFTRYIFHEVRGPLNNLSLSIELLASSPIVQSNADLRDLITLMGKSTGHVRCITDDVLFLAKVESSEFNLVFAPLSVGDVVLTSFQQLNHLAAAHGVDVTVDIDSDIPPLLLGVSNRLRQVLTNFLGNGIKFVPEGSGRIRVTARVVDSHCRAMDPEVVAALGDHTAAGPSTGARGTPIAAHALALGLANGNFSRGDSLTALGGSSRTPRQSDTTPHISHDPLWRSLVERITALFHSPLNAVSSAESGAGASTASASLSDDSAQHHDPRLPMASRASGPSARHVVDLPSTIEPLETIVVVRFEVEDNGCGLTSEHIARLFKPYSQVNTHRREAGGTGLGLFISLRLVEQMGGRIGAESGGEGLGATFWFEVPLRVLQPATAVSVPTQEFTAPRHRTLSVDESSGLAPVSRPVLAWQVDAVPPPAVSTASPLPVSAGLGLAGGGGGPASLVQLPPTPAAPDGASAIAPISAPIHVLVVDDVDTIRMLMRRLLKRHMPNAVITEAADGLVACEAIAVAKAAGSPLFTAGVVCMDKEMPRCDGFEATTRIRALGFAGLILGVTGNAIAEDIVAFLDRGANAIITKPVSFPVLMAHLARWTEIVQASEAVGAVDVTQVGMLDTSLGGSQQLACIEGDVNSSSGEGVALPRAAGASAGAGLSKTSARLYTLQEPILGPTAGSMDMPSAVPQFDTEPVTGRAGGATDFTLSMPLPVQGAPQAPGTPSGGRTWARHP